ncbi:hypothetical protein TYRP_002476 [Tyrophagus putrescentiae]|nr:hypothetical protein TYRP_002476 [Tyrophagus putrescentiae]
MADFTRIFRRRRRRRSKVEEGREEYILINSLPLIRSLHLSQNWKSLISWLEIELNQAVFSTCFKVVTRNTADDLAIFLATFFCCCQISSKTLVIDRNTD